MRDLPSGTVTFLFTDVEGSTRLLRELGDGYADVLADHRRVLRDVFRSHAGVEVDTQGDAFFVAFASAPAAVAAAKEAQRALEDGPLRVRIGIHTGRPTVTAEGYFGLDVHKAARIAATSHGGQVVLSGETHGHLGETVPLLDLGEHRLKDFDEPVCLFQLGTRSFPPLRTISSTNLPRPASSLVGRQHEMEEVVALVRGGSRLVTLTGPGGVGKTRLAIEAAAQLVPDFRAGVFWVGLAPLRDDRLVTETIAQTLGAKGGLVDHIAQRELLLLLDNLEQVIEAASELSVLLEACPNLYLVVTSRELLRIRGEVEYPVLSLSEPEAVELFGARAGIEPDASVADLCRALDALPLAVELAAARVSVLSPRQILERLSQRLDLFKGGRDADPRQRTLRATIEWSYDLLTPEEQRLFGRLSVFVGGCTLEETEEVVGADLDTLQALVAKSLLRHSDERFWMLETIREYAVERLEESDAAGEWRSRHAECFLALAERVEPELEHERQDDWLEPFERDYANMRAALAWSLASGRSDLALRLVSALGQFWFRRGYLGEGRQWLAELLAVALEPSCARAKALFNAALLAALQGDWPEAKRWSQECHQLGLDIGEHDVAAQSLLTLGRATLAEGDHERACSLFEDGAALARQAGADFTVTMASFNLGYAALSIGEYARARGHFQLARERMAEREDRYGVARSLAALGSVALHERQPGEAIELLHESLVLSRAVGDRDDIAWGLQLVGVACSESEGERAARLLGAAEALREELGGTLEGVELSLHERAISALRSRLSAETLTSAWAAGRDLSLEQAVEHALGVDDVRSPRLSPGEVGLRGADATEGRATRR